MVIKLCIVIELEIHSQNWSWNFCNGHRFHGNCLIKLNKKCPNASFLERLMKEYDWNAFGHVSSLAGNTRNKSARFSFLDMGTRPFFRVFPLFKNWTIESQKIFKKILADLFLITRKDYQTNAQVSLKYMEANGRGNDLKIASFFSFFLIVFLVFLSVAFWNSKCISCKASRVIVKFCS